MLIGITEWELTSLHSEMFLEFYLQPYQHHLDEFLVIPLQMRGSSYGYQPYGKHMLSTTSMIYHLLPLNLEKKLIPNLEYFLGFEV